MKYILKKVEDKFYLLSDDKIPEKGYRMDMVRNTVGMIDNPEYYNSNRNDYKLIIASTDNLERVNLIDAVNMFELLEKDQNLYKDNEMIAYVEMVNSPTHIDRYGDLRYNAFEPKVTDGFIKILKLTKNETDKN